MGLIPKEQYIRMGPPAELVTQLANEYAIDNFIETGTYYGDTSIWAAQNFRNVFTIESSKELYEENVRKFSNASNIEFLCGDSRVELRKVVQKLTGVCLFWLDAHWCGESTYGEDDQCPLNEEINIINNCAFDSFILIDDARLFTSPPEPPNKMEQWPDIVTVINSLRASNTERYIVIIEDVIVAVPNFAKASVACYCQNVKTRDWEEYKRQQKTSNFKKGLTLIQKDLKTKLGHPREFIRGFFQYLKNQRDL